MGRSGPSGRRVSRCSDLIVRRAVDSGAARAAARLPGLATAAHPLAPAAIDEFRATLITVLVESWSDEVNSCSGDRSNFSRGICSQNPCI